MSIKKVLLVGSFSDDPKIYTYASSFYKAFQNLKLGPDLELIVEKFNCKNPKSKLNFWGNILEKYLLNRSLFKTIKTFKPDLIFMLKADNITAKTLMKIKKNTGIKNSGIKNSGIKLVNFYPDNPFVFWNGNSNSDVLLSLPIYDLFLIWSKQLIPIIHSAGAKNVQYFPFGFDPAIFTQDIKITDKDVSTYKSDVCFVGSWDPERESWLTRLMHKKPTINLAIWGNRWDENLPQNSILRPYLKGRAIYGIDMVKAFRLSAVVLNFIRKQNLDAHNMRTIEVAACGSFLLTERTKEQAESLFKQGVSIECFSDINELINKIEFYLTNTTARATIIKNALKMSQEYTIEKLLLVVLKNLDK